MPGSSPSVLAVFGTRPEAIKMAPVVLRLRHDAGVRVRVCVTAQHREMLDDVLETFAIEPDYDLDIMRRRQSPARVTAAVLARLEPVLTVEEPDWVLVQGDTCTASAAALGGHYAGARVAHVEAGLRSFDLRAPFPEEANRRVVAAVCDLNFAPTVRARDNLLREGANPATVVVTGNPVIDALHLVAGLPSPRLDEILAAACGRHLVLVTAHRRENLGAPLDSICEAVFELAAANRDRVEIVFPAHPNPRVGRTVARWLSDQPNVRLLEPLGYRDLVAVMSACHFVMTDSGGIQEEAPGLGKPVLVLRDVTERPEGVEAGAVRLVGTDHRRIVAEAIRLLDDADHHRRMARAVNPYGDGRASERITAALRGEHVEELPGAALHAA